MRKIASALLIDDDDAFRVALQGALRRRGLRALTAATVTEALHILEDAPIDLVAIDFRMPETDGLQAIAKVRALQPDAVIAAQEYPVSHIDLFARHRWLTEPTRVATLRDALLDPEWPGDAKIAGWWLWGQCAWIGDGWCAGPVANGESLGKIPATTSGHGVSALSLGPAAARDVRAWLDALSARLSRVRVLHGDWRRCLGMSANYDAGDVAVFLDPPYEGFEALYSESAITAQAAAAWARENEGSRIALCGHIGDYEMPGWSVMEWSRLRTSFGSAKTKDAECIWFSPGCLPDAPAQASLFGGAS